MTLPRRLKTFTTSSVHRRNDNTEGLAIMTFLQNCIANIAHKRSALMNIYEITDLWPRQNSERHWIAGQGAFYGATAACAGFILIGFFMIFSTPIHSMSDELGRDQVMGLVVALFFLFCWISIFWHHHFLKAKLEIIRSAKARLARDADLHDEYLACVERAGAVAIAHSRAAAAAQEARNAVRVAIDRIYRFDRFDPTGNADGDRALGEILRFIQTQRNKDKAFLRGGRGLAHADHVYRNVIAHAIKCAALEELRDQAVSRS